MARSDVPRPSPLAPLRRRLVAAVLRTPLHPTLARRFVLLHGVGDRVLERPVALRYAPHEGRLIVLAPQHDTWWTGLSAEIPTPCALRHRGQEVTADGRLAAGDALDEAILRYLQKHPGEWRRLGVTARADAGEVEAAAQRQAVVLIDDPAASPGPADRGRPPA